MLAYAIKSAIFLSIMYIPYMLILRKESFFHFNRILLVCIMLLSLILPLCDFHALSIENNDFNTNWRLHAGWCFFCSGRVASLRLLQKENVAANIEQKNKEIEK